MHHVVDGILEVCDLASSVDIDLPCQIAHRDSLSDGSDASNLCTMDQRTAPRDHGHVARLVRLAAMTFTCAT